LKSRGCTASGGTTNNRQIVYELPEKWDSSLDLIEKIWPEKNLVYELSEIDNLRKHRTRVDSFYRDTIDVLTGQQEILSKYKKRFERYRDSMFTFLGKDGIPWNNNAAERALRHLAVQRKISGRFL
jgi:hypothetical protein